MISLLPLSLFYVNWVSQEGCLFYLRFSLRSSDLPLPYFRGLSPCLLAAAIWDAFFLFCLPNTNVPRPMYSVLLFCAVSQWPRVFPTRGSAIARFSFPSVSSGKGTMAWRAQRYFLKSLLETGVRHLLLTSHWLNSSHIAIPNFKEDQEM